MDPSGPATEIRLELAGREPTVSRSWYPRPLGSSRGYRRPRGGTGAPVHMAETERELLERAADFTPPGVYVRPYSPDVLLAGYEILDLAGIAFETIPVPGHSPGHVAFAADGALFSGMSSLPALSAARICRRELGDLAASIAGLLDRLPAETVVYPGHGPARRSARSSRRTRSSPNCAPRGPDGRAVKIEAPRGTHDILPADQPLWQRVVGRGGATLCALRLPPDPDPVFEDTALFERTSGAGSDVVQKEMYTFEDRSGRSLTLRPEGTAPICRAYVQHGLHREPQPQKLYTLATMYRYSAPQKGRYREHWQISVEAIGSTILPLDAEVIQLYDTLLRRLGVTQYRLALNSIGDPACRPAYPSASSAGSTSTKSCSTRTRARRHTSPLRVFDNPRRSPRRSAGRSRTPRRSASRCVTHAGSISRPCSVISTPTALLTSSSRPWCAGSTTTRARRGSSWARPGSAEHDLGRGPLRRPRRGDRRSAYAGRRFRSRHRAARARAGGGRCHCGARAARAADPARRGRRPAGRAGRAREAAGGRRRLRHRVRGPVAEGPVHPALAQRRARLRAGEGGRCGAEANARVTGRGDRRQEIAARYLG